MQPLVKSKVVDIELCRPLASVAGLDGYEGLQSLVRLHGVPIGYVQMPVHGGRCSASELSQAILEQHSGMIIRHLLCDALAASPPPDGWRVADVLTVPHPASDAALPMVTVAVCTRDRTADLARCLDALCRLEYPALDLLVVDNAPSIDATERLVHTSYPTVRYVCEPRPGLDWARNRAILEARGEIIAYTDDDVVVDAGWVRALASVFAEHPEVMAVTGLVVPYELETEAQLLFERYGGFGRGFERRWYRVDRDSGECAAAQHGGTGKFGTGANMAYRRGLFDHIGAFDPALDVGTVTHGGGDHEMFFRVLKAGHTLVYEPNAVVYHRHRQDYARLRMQITNNGVGLYAYFVRNALAYPDERLAFMRLGLWWLWRWHIRRLLISLVHPSRFPRDLILAELRGACMGLGRYPKARAVAARIAGAYRSLPQASAPLLSVPRAAIRKLPQATAVRTIDLRHPVQALRDLTDYASVRVFVTWHGRPLGSVDIANARQSVSAARLRQAIVDRLDLKLLEPSRHRSMASLHAEMLAALTKHYTLTAHATPPAMPMRLSPDVPVSVVVATYDRPEGLRRCLRCLVAQESPRQVDIVVVDNHPASGLTPPVVAEFPGVILVREPRQGLAYARNAGIIASTGAIIVTTDDDVTMPSDWLEKLLAPFVRNNVMIVTGNVLPLELEMPAQRLFEAYGGLGRGFEPLEVGGDWFKSFWRQAVPTWKLGATANAAFRASLFRHPQIGLLAEALGPGMPSGVGEDTYLFYKVLKAGYTLVYEPGAYVWHRHRRDLRALRHQIYNYSKGHVAYHLTTLLRDHDLRTLMHLFFALPRWHFRRIIQRLRGRNAYPLWLLLLEISGNLVGPWALWRSHRRVKREGRSDFSSRHASIPPLVETP